MLCLYVVILKVLERTVVENLEIKREQKDRYYVCDRNREQYDRNKDTPKQMTP